MEKIINTLINEYNRKGINVKVQVLTDKVVSFRIKGKDVDVNFEEKMLACEFIQKCRLAIEKLNREVR